MNGSILDYSVIQIYVLLLQRHIYKVYLPLQHLIQMNFFYTSNNLFPLVTYFKCNIRPFNTLTSKYYLKPRMIYCLKFVVRLAMDRMTILGFIMKINRYSSTLVTGVLDISMCFGIHVLGFQSITFLSELNMYC